MSELDANPAAASATGTVTGRGGFFRRYILDDIVYLILIVLAVIGVAYTDVAPGKSTWYWEVMAPLFGLFCVISEWFRVKEKGLGRMELIRTQILHWGAFLFLIWLVFLPVVQQNLNSDITGNILLIMLALSTFLAGVYLNWRLCVVGILMGFGVIVTAMLDQSVFLILVIAIVIAGVSIFWRRSQFKQHQQHIEQAAE
jgi:uncharacterized membrane protein